MKYICFLFTIYSVISCQSKQQVPSTYRVTSYRYVLGNAYEAGTTDYFLKIDNQGDTLRKYTYFRPDTINGLKDVQMQIEVRNDTSLLMPKGDFMPDVRRVLESKKTFYMGSQEIEVSKFRRLVLPEGKNDFMFMTKEFGIVNMLSYDAKIQMIYRFASDKAAINTVKEINRYLEKDSTGFYHQIRK